MGSVYDKRLHVWHELHRVGFVLDTPPPPPVVSWKCGSVRVVRDEAVPMKKVEIHIDDELARVVGYIDNELKSAIVRDEMKQILDVKDDHLITNEDRRYYKRLKKAAKVVYDYYGYP